MPVSTTALTRVVAVLLGGFVAALGQTERGQRLFTSAAARASIAPGLALLSPRGSSSTGRITTSTAASCWLAVVTAWLLGVLSTSPVVAAAQVLASRPLVLAGMISYSLYLWHWPVFVFVSSEATGLAGLPLALLQIGVSLVGHCELCLRRATVAVPLVERSRRSAGAIAWDTGDCCLGGG
ncbi:MAG: hypothetical protein R2706_05980 [Acidimicrobiales bacterium]